MVDFWIIKDLEKRQEKDQRERLYIEMPLPYEEPEEKPKEEESNRGIITINIWDDEEEE